MWSNPLIIPLLHSFVHYAPNFKCSIARTHPPHPTVRLTPPTLPTPPDSDLADEYHIKTHWKIILAGARGAGMFNHSDSLLTASWHAHLMGEKWWYVCGYLLDGSQQCYEVGDGGQSINGLHKKQRSVSLRLNIRASLAPGSRHQTTPDSSMFQCLSTCHESHPDLNHDLNLVPKPRP